LGPSAQAGCASPSTAAFDAAAADDSNIAFAEQVPRAGAPAFGFSGAAAGVPPSEARAGRLRQTGKGGRRIDDRFGFLDLFSHVAERWLGFRCFDDLGLRDQPRSGNFLRRGLRL
jgi:hypothetical protein